MASSSELNLKPIVPPTGIKLTHSEHSDVLELNAIVKATSSTLLDMKVYDEKDGNQVLVYDVKGKFLTMSRKVTIKDANGKELYVLKQRKVKYPFSFWSVDREGSKDDDDQSSISKEDFSDEKEIEEEEAQEDSRVFVSDAKGGFKLDFLDLETTIFPDSKDGKEKKFSLKTGPLKTISDITDGEGNVVAHINRTTSTMKKIWNPAENYLIRTAPGVDASMTLLICICLHIQLVNYKMGTLW